MKKKKKKYLFGKYGEFLDTTANSIDWVDFISRHIILPLGWWLIFEFLGLEHPITITSGILILIFWFCSIVKAYKTWRYNNFETSIKIAGDLIPAADSFLVISVIIDSIKSIYNKTFNWKSFFKILKITFLIIASFSTLIFILIEIYY